MNSRDLRDKRATLWEQAKALLDRAETEDRKLSAEERETFNRLDEEMTDLGERIETQEHLESTHWTEPAAENRAVVPASARLVAATPSDVIDEVERHRLMDSYLRYGAQLMDPDDFRAFHRVSYQSINAPVYQNAQGTTSGPSGGFLVRESWRAAVVEATKAFGGMREIAEVITTADGGPYHFMTADDTSNVGSIIAENQTVSETSVTWGVRTLQAYMYTTGYVPVSYQLLQDSAIDIESYLTRIFATRLGRILNTHFTTGTGVNQPQGIATASTSGVTAAAQAAVTFDELIDLEHSVDPSYRGMQGVRFMFNDTTLRELKQLKDGEGRPLWMPGTTTGEPSTLLGYRYVINQDVASMATGNKAIFFGDLSAYKIRDVRDMMVLRLEELHALNGQVTFLAFSRHDGGLIDAGQNPVKHITMA